MGQKVKPLRTQSPPQGFFAQGTVHFPASSNIHHVLYSSLKIPLKQNSRFVSTFFFSRWSFDLSREELLERAIPVAGKGVSCWDAVGKSGKEGFELHAFFFCYLTFCPNVMRKSWKTAGGIIFFFSLYRSAESLRRWLFWESKYLLNISAISFLSCYLSRVVRTLCWRSQYGISWGHLGPCDAAIFHPL